MEAPTAERALDRAEPSTVFVTLRQRGGPSIRVRTNPQPRSSRLRNVFVSSEDIRADEAAHFEGVVCTIGLRPYHGSAALTERVEAALKLNRQDCRLEQGLVAVAITIQPESSCERHHRPRLSRVILARPNR